MGVSFVLRVFCSRKERHHVSPTNRATSRIEPSQPAPKATGTATTFASSPHWTIRHRELGIQVELSHCTPGVSSHYCGTDAARRRLISAAAIAAVDGTYRHRAACAPASVQAPTHNVQQGMNAKGTFSSRRKPFAVRAVFPNPLLSILRSVGYWPACHPRSYLMTIRIT